ncbi:hypothetical protein FA95DRAFT_1018753 [Auriscalpium vulgare]|uniref:Uncharacterized protein n=1 Tax=Auriscalpium vulgare TaxID=40419 RepID=A0ACB8R6E7_9AGAM|nr:hypothetical protein FA95DRAFT_1018753 [Auriscalpium vulgare]
MPRKLHLKRTPAEQAEHDLRKARRAARKAARGVRDDSDPPRRTRKRRQPSGGPSDRDDSDTEYGPQPAGPSTSRADDFEDIRASVEEQRFQEKMWGAFMDDDRLDAVEARMNDYAHVPKRWRGAQVAEDVPAGDEGDPLRMDDEEYAEWVRAGMWRRKNAAAVEEEARQKAAYLAAQAEAARKLKAKEEVRKRKRWEREQIRKGDIRAAYERRWTEILIPTTDPPALRFGDVPWPVTHESVSLELLTAENISAFLALGTLPGDEDAARTRKERLRETMLRFHPDKFEGRVMKLVRDEDREAVREGVGAVVRAVTTLMAAP